MEKGLEYVQPKEFFWDSFINFLVVMMVSLVGVDVVTELVRPSEVVCTSSIISNGCVTDIPSGAYISTFIFLHAIVLLSAHVLWRYHHDNIFKYFYESLKKFKISKSGILEISDYNIEHTKQLTHIFSMKTIFQYYILKLIFQLLWVICGLVFVVTLFWDEFRLNIDCSVTAVENFHCVYSILTLLRVLWMLEIIFLFLCCIIIILAILWCFDVHWTELGSANIALFCFNYGLPSKCYKTKVSLSPWYSLVRVFCNTIPLLQRLIYGGPHIVHSLDFLVINLFYSSHPTGSAFKELQIKQYYKELCSDDQRRLNAHTGKQINIMADDTEDEGVLYKTKDKASEHMELMWNFGKKSHQPGIYDDYEMLSSHHPVVLPGTVQGTILGFASRAPSNESAIEVSFAAPSFYMPLARVFKSGCLFAIRFIPISNSVLSGITFLQVTAISFNSNYQEVMTCTKQSPFILKCPENLALDPNTNDVLKKNFLKLWNNPSSNQISKAAFVVIGPITGSGVLEMTTVDSFFDLVARYLCNDAVLLIMRPLQYYNYDVTNTFCSYHPSKSKFEPLEQTYDVIHKLQEWVARKSVKIQPGNEFQLPGRKQSVFRLPVFSGGVPCTMEFRTYRFIGIHTEPIQTPQDRPRETNI